MSALTSLALGSGLESRKARGRLQAVVLHGSFSGGVVGSKETWLSQLIHLISLEEDVVMLSAAGVGTDGALFNRLRGSLGRGFNYIVVMTYKTIAENYRLESAHRECDRILLAGFSRGGSAAIKVARLIDVVGIALDSDEKLYKRLYKLCYAAEPWDEEAIREVKRGYQWIHDVKVAELLVFDVVSTLGVPPTGIGQVLKLLPSWARNVDHIIKVPSNVEHASHAIILHDPREPYEHSTLCIPAESNQVLRQVYFHGRHSDSMNIGPLAWQVQNLKTDMNLKFDQCRLDAHFPGPSDEDNAVPGWVFSTVKRVKPMYLALLGSKPRSPGRYSHVGMVTNEEVHSSLRHRGCGRIDKERAVEGFHPSSDPRTGRHTWVQNSSSNSSNKSNSSSAKQCDAPLRLPEAKVGKLERTLSGLPAN